MPPLAASGVTAPNQPAPDRPAPETAGTLLDRVRASAPLVHSITNNVVTNFTANALLALGAAPAMVDIVGEAGMFARVASGLLVNLGTPTPEQRGAIAEAVAGAREAGTPWVLDPVAIGSLPIRTALAAELVTQRPTAVRGNPSEVLALAGAGSGGRGVESSDTAASARDAAVELARRFGTVVAVSGEEDCITDGHSVVWVSGGDALLTKVTGGGCALGAIVAALLAVRVEHSVLDAVVAAHASYGVAAKRAASRADGPGSFAVELLDALAAITPQQVVDESRWRVELVGDSAASVPVAAVPVDAAPAEAAGDAA